MQKVSLVTGGKALQKNFYLSPICCIAKKVFNPYLLIGTYPREKPFVDKSRVETSIVSTKKSFSSGIYMTILHYNCLGCFVYSNII